MNVFASIFYLINGVNNWIQSTNNPSNWTLYEMKDLQQILY